ncbi:terminase small subunit [Paraliobacillus sp. X-1268]|uniref:terminase small subunit n=1 Tax=Paraliobacillus sp. X-1268 TaxID=2213193 RepID=UPI00351717E8
MSKKLTGTQRRFADEYIITGNASKAARDVGYSEAYAKTHVYKLLENARVDSYIKERLEKLQSEKVADQQEVMEYLTSVLRGEVQDEVLLVVGDGDFGSSVERNDKRSDTNDRTKASELLGKRVMLCGPINNK